MTRRDDDPSDRPDARAALALRRIAVALGSPVETFFRQPTPKDDAQSSQELLRLWSELPDLQARRRLLAQMRREVERHQHRSEAAE